MKKLLLSLFALLLTAPVMAQNIAKGYYRVQNFSSQRYIFLVDDKTTGMKVHSTGYDVDALRTYGPFSRVVSDPSTVFYIENAGGYNYNMKGQGKDVYDFVGRYITIKPVNYQGKTYYTASGIYQGIEVFLADGKPDPDEPEAPGFLNTDGTPMQKMWDIIPVSSTNDNNYFGITPEVTAGNKYYAAFFASFPFKPAANGMKVYTVTKYDVDMAIYTEVQGTVAGGTPVIIECPSASVSGNRIDIQMQNATAPAGNLLKGEYFNSSDFYPDADFYHYNAKPWNAATMRVLGVTSTGKLGFVKNTTLTTIPRNKAYLVVGANAPDEIALVTAEEYEQEIARDAVTVRARSYSRAYGDANPRFEYEVIDGTLKGTPEVTCSATKTSPVGTYPITVTKGTSTNRKFTGVDGTLTVTKAPLTITAKSYTISQIDQLPDFAVTYSGFKNNEKSTVLAQQPTVTCNVPEGKYLPEGTYDIVVSGAEAGNYDISYVNGTLTVTKAPLVTLKAQDVTVEYGEDIPSFTYTASADVDGTPVLTCYVPASASVDDTYTITVERGTVDYPNLKLENGTLTITPAPLTASVGNYTRNFGEANPNFVIAYEGFKKGETEEVLTVKPTATCEAKANSAPGFYDIVVSGGEAHNYTFTYVNGRLEVVDTQGITALTVRFDRPVDIFTTDGRCVRHAATTTAGLPRGLYIVNGHKVVVR